MQKVRKTLNKFGHFFNRVWRAITPGPRAWKGATLGLLAATLLIWLIFSYSIFAAQPRVVSTLIGTVVGLLLAALISGVQLLLGALLKVAPMSYRWVLFGALVLVSSSFVVATPIGALVTALALIVVSSLLGAAVGVLASGGLKDTAVVQRTITIVGLLLGAGGLVFGTAWLMGDGPSAESPLNAAAETSVETLDMPDPSLPGEFAVQTLFYGSGNDLHRAEYADRVDLMTETVDGSPFIDGWEGIVGWSRTSYWGFEPDDLPLNGRVWYPAGEGPFPLVLVVHGNHAMEDFSDPGYDYLGQLLASRGFIVASIDENFLNLSWADMLGGLEEENDARGWLLLEHLRLWREWNKIPDNAFYQKIDMDRIALIGHSRGGEAVAIAAAFNTLPNYPDDATITFDYGFNIRSVVAIAPVDGQYMPTGVGTPGYQLKAGHSSIYLSFRA